MTLQEIESIRSHRGILLEAEKIQAALRWIDRERSLLVFGCGMDSALWHSENLPAKTRFVEDDPKWARKARGLIPDLTVLEVKYHLIRDDWKRFLRMPEFLELQGIDEIRETRWDVIIVDGPQGDTGTSPGRMQSIYEASRLRAPESHILVNDCNREVERAYCNEYLNGAYAVDEIGTARMYHFYD